MMIARVFVVLAVFLGLSWPPLRAAETFPSSAVGFLEASDRRADWWARNFGRTKLNPTDDCWINQPDSGFQTLCKQVFSADQIIRDEERSIFRELKGAEARRYARIRTSLFLTPVPMTPVFLSPILHVTPPRKVHDGLQVRLPIGELTAVLRRTTFDAKPRTMKLDANLSDDKLFELQREFSLYFTNEIFQYQWGWNISYEEIGINPSLRAGWDFWSRAADARAIECVDRGDSSGIAGAQLPDCIAVIIVTSAKRRFEPEKFSSGVAVCWTDAKRIFYNNCSLVTMQTTEGRQYVKAIVGPAHPMGGGAFANNAGMFTLTCDFPQGNLRKRLLEIRDSLGFGGTYTVAQSIDIRSSTGFRYFDATRKWGEIMMWVSEREPSSDQVSIIFMGRWSNRNVNDNKIPLFEDHDVEQFKAAVFEPLVGRKNACRKEAASMPMIAQR